MSQRFIDYGIVLAVVLVLSGLFRLSRYLLGCFIKKQNSSEAKFTSDQALFWGMIFLLGGMITLPFVTSILAFVHNGHLVGGMTLHLVMTALSVVLFSFSEDLFRDYNSYGSDSPKSVSWHTKRLLVPLLVFWLTGCVFLSPLFYSGLTVLIAVFYRLCLYFRKTTPLNTITGKAKNAG